MLTVVQPSPPQQMKARSTCESCQRRPACVTLRWPDASFDVCQNCAALAPPLEVTLLTEAAREVLLTAARTLTTSRFAARGLRLTSDGDCDVVAAVMLAAGGAINESGRLLPLEEQPAARVYREALTQLARHLAQRTWPDDPVLLIDAWQAGPDVNGPIAVATIRAAAARRVPVIATWHEPRQVRPAADHLQAS